MFGYARLRVPNQFGEVFYHEQVSRGHFSEHLPTSSTGKCGEQGLRGKTFGWTGGRSTHQKRGGKFDSESLSESHHSPRARAVGRKIFPRGRNNSPAGRSFSLVGRTFSLGGRNFSLVGRSFSLGRRTFSLVGRTFSPAGRSFSLGGRTFSLGGRTFSLGGRSFSPAGLASNSAAVTVRASRGRCRAAARGRRRMLRSCKSRRLSIRGWRGLW
jgi:hypothetical protein